jgi:CheY-like chemotaxis protein
MGQVMYAIEFFNDITAQKKIQISMQDAKNVAEKASKLKSSFLSNINHEIRTPLNAIMGFSKLMIMKSAVNEAHKEYLEVIHSSGQRLLDTISGIIELSRLQSGDYVIANEVFNMNKLLVSIGDSFKEHPNVFSGKIQFTLSLPTNQLWINTDKFRLTQVITHLLDNAIKFTEKGIVFLGLEIRSGSIAIVIQDSGQGINSENPKEIFEYFGKDHLKTHPLEGSGLGLAMAYHNAKAIGGQLEFVTSDTSGSRFELLLSHEFTQTAPKGPMPEVEWKKTNILIAEDDETNFLYLQELLGNTGLKLSHAGNGKQTLEMFDESVDLLLLDIQMPIIDGIRIAKTIRETGSKVPIIALTAHNYREKECLEAGCNQFITKPINSSLLFSVLRQYLT